MATMTSARQTAWTDAQRVAPLLVTFDIFDDPTIVTPPVNGSGDPDPARWYYFWNFGDHACGAWSTTSKSKNTATGMVAPHVYEKPGTYTPTLRVYDDDGVITTYTQTIVVTDPDTIFSAANTFYYSSTGLDANAGTIASPCLTATQGISTSAKGSFAAAGPRRIRFKRGESFDKTTSASLSSLAGPYLIDSYGDENDADPIINVSDGLVGLQMAATVTGVRMVDIDLRGPVVGLGLADADFNLDNASWTEGAGWAVGSGVATGTLAATDLSQAASGMTVGNSYETTFSVKTRTAGSVAIKLGTTTGTSRSSVNAFTQTLVCAGSATVAFAGTGFTGTLDDVFIVTSSPGIIAGNDSLFLRCAIDRFSSGFSNSDALGVRSGNGVVDCTLGSNLTSYGIYLGNGYQCAILGNTITTLAVYNNEHSMRQYISHGVVSHNQLTGGGRGKTNMRMAGYYPPTGLTNDTFAADSDWTKGAQWTIAAGVATKTGAGTSVLSQTITNGGTGLPRPITWSCTRTSGSGSIRARYGGQVGTDRTTATQATETIFPSSGALLEFVPDSDWEGSIDFVPTASIADMDSLWRGDEVTAWLEYTWITDNILDPSDDLAFAGAGGVGTPFMFGVTNSGDAQYARNCVVERNRINIGNGNQAAIESDAACYFTYRNNVIDMTDDPGTSGIRIRRSAATSLTATGNQALNNTILCNASFAGTGINYGSGSIALAAANTVIRNTHLCKSGGAGAASASAGNETGSDVTDTATDTTTAGVLVMPTDARPSATSGARGVGFANAATAQRYVRDTIDRVTFHTTRNEAGAYEIGFTATEPATVGNAIGFNRDDCEYDSTDYAFVDLMQMSGNTSSPYGWDTVDDGTFGANTGDVTDFVDVDGWPKVTLPFDGGDGLAVLRKRFRSPTTGLHTIYFDGAGTLVFTGAASATVTTSGSTINITTADTDVIVDLTVTNVSNLIKNIKCILPGHEATYTTAPYYPTATTRMAAVARAGQRTVFRAMNWRRTNGDKPTSPLNETTWDRRSTLTKHTQGSSFGVAWEHCARIANAISGDLWVCIPHQATNGYVRSLAQLLLGELSSTASLWVEPTNEQWNGDFDQKAHFETLGNTTGFTGTAAVKGRKQYCKSAVEWFEIFQTEWGEANSGRLRFVLGTQASSTTVTDNLMDYVEEVTLDSIPMNPNVTRIHACALAPYFGLHTSTGDRFGDDGVDEGWYLTDTAAAGVARIPATYRPLAYTNMTNQIASLAVYAAIASKPYTGIIPVCYEAGPNVISSGANSGNSNLTTFLQGVLDHDSMGTVCRDYINNWWALGGKLMCWFDLCGARTGTNAYGALQHIDNTYSDDPIYAALIGVGTRTASSGAVLAWAGVNLDRINRRPVTIRRIR